MSFVKLIHRTRAILVVLSFFAIVGVVLAFSFLPQNSVELPIEVIGPDGYTQQVTVHASDVNGVDSLYLKTHSIGYPQHYIDDRGYEVSKASIRLNGGSWVDIDNSVVECRYPEQNLMCVTGPMHTIRFEMAISDLGRLQNGSNTIEFRFNYPGPNERNSGVPGDPSTGYRILDIQLRDAGDTDHIDGTTLTWDDPSSWSAPDGYGDAQSVAEGEELWRERNKLQEGWDGGQITASCADCHADDGRDLQYFAFSNWSIIARSEFHGLSEDEAKKIAAYIRSLELKDADTGESYDPPGRPWHPPYQPGPTAVGTRSEDDPRTAGQSFSESSSQLWAAGAGVDWSLDHDKEMLPYLFPGGVSVDDIHPDASLDVRELPISWQFPDWNEWLPEQHPLDLYGSDFTNTGSNKRHPWKLYQGNASKPDFEDIRSCVNGGGDMGSCVDEAFNTFEAFIRGVEDFRYENTASGGGVPDYEAQYSLKRWQAVKEWEVIHTYDLMDELQRIYEGAASLQWPSPRRDVFNHASHIISHDLKGPQEGAHDLYYDNAWYDLQLVINSGQGFTTGMKPEDWKYQFSHLRGTWASSIDHPQPLRYTRSYVRLMQNANMPNSDQFRTEKFPEGWYLRHTQLGQMDRFESSLLNRYQAGLEAEVLTAVTRAWYLGAVEGNDWANSCREGGQWCIEPKSTDVRFITRWKPKEEQNYANTTFSTIASFRDKGVDPAVLDDLRNWGKSLWPNASNPSWDDLLKETQSVEQPPSISLTSPSSDLNEEAPGELTVQVDASDTDGRVEEVRFMVDGERVHTDSSSPYEYSWSDISAGTYEVSAIAVDNDGKTATSNSITAVFVDPSSSSGGSGTPTLVTAVNAGGSQYQSGDGTVFDADGQFTGGSTYTSSNAIAGTTNDQLYQSERYGEFSYTATVPNGDYELVFKMAEVYHESAGQRIFDVLVEGQEVISDLDIYAEAGKNTALDVIQRITVEDGELNVTFRAERDNPKLSALVIRPADGGKREVTLAEGWNIVSLGVEPSDPSMESVLGDAASKIAKVESASGGVYIPEDGTNSIGDWNPQEAYRVYADASASFVVEGTPIPVDAAEIQLEKGWNWVPYLGSASQSVENAFSSLGDNLVIVKNEAGDVYHPKYEVKSLKAVEPGSGYMVYVSRSSTLTYTDAGSSSE